MSILRAVEIGDYLVASAETFPQFLRYYLVKLLGPFRQKDQVYVARLGRIFRHLVLSLIDTIDAQHVTSYF